MILVGSIAKIVGDILHSQTTFIKGISIIDNIHLVQELLKRYTRKQISPRCIMKIDLHKTFDFSALDIHPRGVTRP